jgi:uncharacterized protein
MRFWDSSALVPLLVEEESSEWCRDLVREDGVVAVWALTRAEIVSAIQRKRRAGELGREAVQQALARLNLVESAWSEVDALRLVRERAERLLAVHPLRAADALQLGAALVLVEERPHGWGFVTADERLAEAAEAERFDVFQPP